MLFRASEISVTKRFGGSDVAPSRSGLNEAKTKMAEC